MKASETSSNSTPRDVAELDNLIEKTDLASALESDRFKRFLDHVPIAIAVSEMREPETIIYANAEFEKISGLSIDNLENKEWDVLRGEPVDESQSMKLASAIIELADRVGLFRVHGADETIEVELHSNVIADDTGRPIYRLVALVDAVPRKPEANSLEAHIREKETQLRELQHRVKNNLQMITSLIRLETRNAEVGKQDGFMRLAGRVSSLALLYDTLSLSDDDTDIDLGVYLSQIATTVMATHAVEGIRLDLQVDTFPVSVNVAMPTGLVVNELLTNSLKHAFNEGDGGTITLNSVVEDTTCKIVIADDGVGLPEGETWPKPGRLGALIADSLKDNARAHFEVTSKPSEGTKVTITFDRTKLAEV